MTDTNTATRSKVEELKRGWLILLSSLLGIAMGGWALPIYFIGPMTAPWLQEFGWSAADMVVSASFLAAGMTMGSLVFGRLLDVFGATRIAGISLLLLAGCFAAASSMSGGIWQLHGLYLLMGLFGAGSGGTTYSRVIGEHFQSARGMALGIALCGPGVAAFCVPLLVQSIIGEIGWRSICWTVAAVIALTIVPVISARLDGSRMRGAGAAEADDPHPAAMMGHARADALRDPRFYILIAIFSLFGLFVGSLIVNMQPMLIGRGVPAAQAAQIMSLLGIANMFARVVTGWLMDHMSAALLGALAFSLGSFGIAFLSGGTGAGPIVAVIVLGLLIGAELDILSYLALRFFGLRAYGQIFSLIFAAFSIASIAGPLLCAWLITLWQHEGLYIGAGGAFLVSALLFLFLWSGDQACS